MDVIWAFIFGAVFGAAIALAAGYFRVRAVKGALQDQLRDAFAGVSSEALAANTHQFLALARETLSAQTTAGAAELDSRKQLIDQSIQQVTQRLEALRGLMGQLESSRKEDSGKLGQRLTEAMQETAELRATAESLRAALAHPQQRGQWGERMAGDILTMAGMIEGVNYTRQQTLDGSARRPDYTFNMPAGIRLNMDVKFPLDNYLRGLQCPDGDGKARAAEAFCGDVRTQIRAIATREYVDPANGTADFALMFIPNEQVFCYLQEQDPTLLTEAARRRVLMVGPLSLLAVLATVRQAAETANLSRQTDEALVLIADFSKQWQRFKEEMDKLEKKLNEALAAFHTLHSTRSNMLERPLGKLEQLRLGAEAKEET